MCAQRSADVLRALEARRVRARILLPVLTGIRLHPQVAHAKHIMERYFLNDREVPETDAAAAWFDHAERQGIDIARAISLWEDASEAEGDDSRRAVAQAGIRVEVDRR